MSIDSLLWDGVFSDLFFPSAFLGAACFRSDLDGWLVTLSGIFISLSGMRGISGCSLCLSDMFSLIL